MSDLAPVRLLGVDFGRKNIGLAVMDLATGLPRPLKPLSASGTLNKDAVALVQAMKKNDAQGMVIGLPLDANGDTKMSRVVRQLSDKCCELDVDVWLVDESLTSQEAEANLSHLGLTAAGIRARVDSEAACQILLRYTHGS